jgi:aspartyl-tRNA(Asn)/glutamyl-tRNA(Gln) amidotransferase subunit C
MKKLPEKEVEWVANLAYIALTDSEKKAYANDLSSVLSYVDELQKVDTSKVEETRQITGLDTVMAKDEINRGEIERETYLKQAPMNEKGFIKVKSVFDR